MDLISQAVSKRERLRAELERLDAFLAVAYELQGEKGQAASEMTDAQKVAAPVRNVTPRAPAGVGAETARAAEEIIREAGRPMATRELVPLVEAHGIEIGGNDKVATLSARLGNDAKRVGGRLQLARGRWHLPHWLEGTGNEETADTPTKEAPAVSFFSHQEGGEP